jgi:HSP20 family protein
MTMTLSRWNPARDLAALEIDRLNRMFGSVFGDESQAADSTVSTWLPPVDIYENADRDLVVKLEVPDMKREDIAVTVENNVLTVSGERKATADVKHEDYRRRERVFGSFRRAFTLSSSVDGGRVHAGYADGVLTITLPQRAEAKPRQIAVEG